MLGIPDREAYAVLSTCFVMFFSACSNVEKASKAATPQFLIVPTDSITVNNLLAELLLFQTASSDYVVFRDIENSKTWITSHQGDILDQWKKEGDMPGAFSSLASALEFTPEGNLVTYDPFSGITVFDIHGNLLMERRVFQPQMSISFYVNLFRKTQVITRDNRHYLLHHLDLMDEVQEIGARFYNSRKNLLMTDLENGKTLQLLPFPEKSKFLSGKAFPFEDFRTIFHYDDEDKVLDIIFQNEPILYSYDWSSEQPVLISAIAMELPDFEEHQGWEYAQVFYGKLTAQGLDSPFPGKIQNLEKIDDKYLISYLPSPDPGKIESWLKTVKGEGTPESQKQIREQMKAKTVLYQKNKNLVEPIELPPMYYNSFKVNGDEIWWMKPANLVTEEEHYTLYKGRLKERGK